jgi:hypothetical protein
MDEKNRKVPKTKVSRKDADEVFIATATEPLRKHKNPVQLTQAERDRNNAKAEEIVLKANEKKKKK